MCCYDRWLEQPRPMESRAMLDELLPMVRDGTLRLPLLPCTHSMNSAMHSGPTLDTVETARRFWFRDSILRCGRYWRPAPGPPPIDRNLSPWTECVSSVPALLRNWRVCGNVACSSNAISSTH